MRLEDFAALVRQRLNEAGVSQHRAALAHGLPADAIRSVLRGHPPGLERTAKICEALGLEFYIGPPRDREAPAAGADAIREAAEAISQAADRAKEAAVVITSLQSRPKANDIEGDSTPAEQAGEDAVIRFPASREVDQIDLAVAAGGGAEADDETVTERLTFRLDWLKSHGLDPSRCTVVKVQGESMEPTLPEGSAILVDRARRRRRVGGIFVVRTGDGVVVKRLGKDEAGGWQLVSDHPSWEPAPWPDEAALIGEVKWMARTL